MMGILTLNNENQRSCARACGPRGSIRKDWGGTRRAFLSSSPEVGGIPPALVQT